ncbi:hypothetical protein FJY68_14145 [candidate division WOR-3 bacterium]|uniref:FlgD/Vpr Ig-like domain-containing protein n=1 Tax=candidate division WOR-3 bacterium TaxID=2052148 RepID=A0A937XJP1_UNCW3|nr:hypothetical protein [candidate division WOR-3 bacterium]
MKKLLLLLAPVLLFAQVEVDTVIRMPSFALNGHFIPELNKLYVLGWYEHYALDCSTWELLGRIPRSWNQGFGCYSWNWRRQKLYVSVNPSPDSLVVIDGIADTLIRTLMWSGLGSAYVYSTDRLYRPVADSFGAIDCASDSLVRGFPSPASGYGFRNPSWDSVGNKLYVSLSAWGAPTKLAVYDCGNDSLRAIIDIPATSTWPTHIMNFNHALRKAYYGIDGLGGPAGVIDTKYDTVIKTFPFSAGHLYNGVALNTRDQKAYILGEDSITGRSALYVIDCTTDTIMKMISFPIKPWPVDLLRWVPWSNRIYLTRAQASSHQDLGMYVIDCNTDSIIVDNLVLGYYPPIDFQIDPIRERVFAIGFESTSVHVLRDTGYAGVAEAQPAGVMPKGNTRARVINGRDGIEVEYQLSTSARVKASVFDATGRQFGKLDAGAQKPGLHRLSWGQDAAGRKLSAGAYFVRIDIGSEHATLKAVVR